MNVRESFEKVRSGKRLRLSLRGRLTFVFAFEILFCVILSYAADYLINDVIRLPVDIPFELVLLCICLLVGMAMTSLVSIFFFDPIKKLRKAMDKVADGDFSVRLEEQSSAQEIMEIYTGFNLMAHELSATEILQTDFVSNVSHEFKTPISAIEGYSALLQDSDNLDDHQRQYVEKILLNTQRLSSLMGSILLLSKLEGQEIPTNQSDYRLDEQIRQSIVALEPAWTGKGIDLDVELDWVNYVGNESMMYHVWSNLISNAIKFSPAGSQIRIRLESLPHKLVFSVSDQGPGISKEAQKHIFDKFYQADNSHKQEGNGLGLALVKRILAIEKGQIQVDNLPEGGCCFTVTLRK